MNLFTLFVTAVGLSMDAFAVSVCKGLALKKARIRDACTVGLWFGGFQALMPFLGYLFGIRFRQYVETVDHWIAFLLLLLIGANMIKESFTGKETDDDASLSLHTMFLLAVATSIDAMAVGITYAFLRVDILPAVSLIGITTFILSAAGVLAGCRFGQKNKKRAQIAGGAILILIGVKILVEHLSETAL